ncbi:MAG: hypothetical protein P1U65_10410 [Minwuia sp.]|nr:hypothetical protein [Minwuia sp.]
MTKYRILFASYGAGHINTLMPVMRALRQRGGKLCVSPIQWNPLKPFFSTRIISAGQRTGRCRRHTHRTTTRIRNQARTLATPSTGNENGVAGFKELKIAKLCSLEPRKENGTHMFLDPFKVL